MSAPFLALVEEGGGMVLVIGYWLLAVRGGLENTTYVLIEN